MIGNANEQYHDRTHYGRGGTFQDNFRLGEVIESLANRKEIMITSFALKSFKPGDRSPVPLLREGKKRIVGAEVVSS